MGEPTQEIAWVFFVLGCRKMKTLSCFDDSGPMKNLLISASEMLKTHSVNPSQFDGGVFFALFEVRLSFFAECFRFVINNFVL